MNRRIPNGTYGGVRGMNNLYSIGERSEPVNRIVLMLYDTESKSRNADFISIAREGNPSPSAPQALSPPERSDATLLHNLRRQPRPLFIICGEAATTTLGAKGPVKLKNPPAAGRSILRTFSFTALLHNLPPPGGHNLRPGGPSTLRPKGRVKKFQKPC